MAAIEKGLFLGRILPPKDQKAASREGRSFFSLLGPGGGDPGHR